MYYRGLYISNMYMFEIYIYIYIYIYIHMCIYLYIYRCIHTCAFWFPRRKARARYLHISIQRRGIRTNRGSISVYFTLRERQKTLRDTWKYKITQNTRGRGARACVPRLRCTLVLCIILYFYLWRMTRSLPGLRERDRRNVPKILFRRWSARWKQNLPLSRAEGRLGCRLRVDFRLAAFRDAAFRSRASVIPFVHLLTTIRARGDEGEGWNEVDPHRATRVARSFNIRIERAILSR